MFFPSLQNLPLTLLPDYTNITGCFNSHLLPTLIKPLLISFIATTTPKLRKQIKIYDDHRDKQLNFFELFYVLAEAPPAAEKKLILL